VDPVLAFIFKIFRTVVYAAQGKISIRSYLKNRKIVRGQGRRRIVTGGIYVNILRITIQAGHRDRAIWHF
jgi:hypothetical protein